MMDNTKIALDVNDVGTLLAGLNLMVQFEHDCIERTSGAAQAHHKKRMHHMAGVFNRVVRLMPGATGAAPYAVEQV